MIFKSIKINKKGFTVLELMVSIVIFSIVCVSVLELVGSTMKLGDKNHKIDTATDLASEAIEVVTMMRDNNFLNNRNYSYGIIGFDTTSVLRFNNVNNSWSLDFGNDNNSENINSCQNSLNNSCAVYKSQSMNYYTQSRNNSNYDLIPSGFFRLIKIQPFENYFKITVTVSWKDSNTNKTIELEKNLWNWD